MSKNPKQEGQSRESKAGKAELLQALADAQAALAAAQAAVKESPSPETREACKAAWSAANAAHVAVHGPPRVASYGCRAGQRQAAEMRAMYYPSWRK